MRCILVELKAALDGSERVQDLGQHWVSEFLLTKLQFHTVGHNAEHDEHFCLPIHKFDRKRCDLTRSKSMIKFGLY